MDDHFKEELETFKECIENGLVDVVCRFVIVDRENGQLQMIIQIT